jgi:hypothetical protein
LLTASYDNSTRMKKTPVFTRADGDFHQAEDIAYFLTGHIFHLLKETDEKKLTEWVNEEEGNKVLFSEITQNTEIQKNLKEFEDIEVERALRRCLKKMKGGESVNGE